MAGNRISSSETIYGVVPLFYLYVWSVKMLYHDTVWWGWMFHSTPLCKVLHFGFEVFIRSCKELQVSCLQLHSVHCFIAPFSLLPLGWIRFHHGELSRILLNDFWWQQSLYRVEVSSLFNGGSKIQEWEIQVMPVIWERFGEMLIKILNLENTGFKLGCLIPLHLLLHLYCLGLPATKVLCAKRIFQIC